MANLHSCSSICSCPIRMYSGFGVESIRSVLDAVSLQTCPRSERVAYVIRLQHRVESGCFI